VIALLVGAGALALLLARLGWADTRRAIVRVGWWFVAIAAIDVVSMMCDAFAIHGFLRAKTDIGYWRVFAAQASGLAINRLTPGNSLGEPVKVTTLARSVPSHLAVSAVVMFNLTTIYIAITSIVIGVPLTALMLDLPGDVAIVVWIGTGVLIAVAIALAVIVRRGAVGTLIGALASLRAISADRAARWRASIADIDARLRDLGHARSSGIARGIAGALGSRVFNWAGTIAVLYAASIPLSPALVVASLSVGILITWATNIIPLGLGLADGGNYVLYGLLGSSPESGLVFAMVNRLRTCVIAAIGLAVMALAETLRRRDA
jgi:uncharacterized protein (TIRG00374 family)